MTNLSITEARSKLGALVNEASYKGERIAIYRNGKPAAVLVSVEDAQLLSELEDRIDLRAAALALAENDFVPLDDLVKELGLD